MNVFTLRLEPKLSKKLEFICQKRGYSKTGLVKRLIRDFLDHQEHPRHLRTLAGGIKNLVGIVSLGGNAVADTENYFE